jgi:hypothetical protein
VQDLCYNPPKAWLSTHVVLELQGCRPQQKKPKRMRRINLVDGGHAGGNDARRYSFSFGGYLCAVPLQSSDQNGACANCTMKHRSRVESCKCCTEPLVSNRNDDRKWIDDRGSTIRLYIHSAVVGFPGLNRRLRQLG